MKQSTDNLGFSGLFRIIKSKDGVPIETIEISNLVVSSTGGHGRNIVMRHLTGDTSIPLAVTHIEIGTGTTAPSASDTDLETASYRAAIAADVTLANNVAIFQAFFPAATVANGTYTEFGAFVNSVVTTLGDGNLWNRSVQSPGVTKDTGEDLTVEIQITATSS